MIPQRSPWRGRLVALAGIALLAFSLRSAVASLSPLLELISADFPLSPVVVGLIATAPPLCFAVFGILTPTINARLGLERSALLSLVLIVIGIFGRAFASDAVTLLALTAVIFAGVAIGNVVLPPLAKKHFPDRLSAVMTVYATMFTLSTFLPSMLAIPVAVMFDWRTSLGWWGVFTAVALIPWLTLIAGERRREDAASFVPETLPPPSSQHLRRMLVSPLAWSIMVVFAASASVAYAAFGWLPVILVEHAGTDAVSAGVLLSLFAAIGLPATLVTPYLVVRLRATLPLFLFAVIATIVGLLGLAFLPGVSPVLWTALYGMQVVLFPLSLVLITVRARDAESAVGLSSFVQSAGYGIAAVFPLLTGVVHDIGGGWVPPLLMLVVITAAAIPFGFVASRGTTVEQEWERRHGRAW